MASARAREAQAPPPPVIGKAGRYTIFITPPPTPKPKPSDSEVAGPRGPSPNPNSRSSPQKSAPLPTKAPPSPPPVQVPPPRFEKPSHRSSGSAFGFFWDAVARVQDVHSSLDEYLADWFGLNQSKYQWALNDYYESNGVIKEGGKLKEPVNKGHAV